MLSKTVRVVALVALLAALPAMAFAQFGHPLKGQWSGEWGPKNNPNRLLLDLQWDGKDLTGRINPGEPSEAAVKKVTIDYSKVDSWKVKVDGTLENLGAYAKLFHGTWMQGNQKGDFTVTRN